MGNVADLINIIAHLMAHYRTCLKKIALYGPTNFATIITGAAEVAKRCKTGEVYHLLVIITDGVITDMQKTKKVCFL